MNLKKNLYLPIEFKHRELLSKLLLTSYASKAGFRVYVGSKSSIYRLIETKRHKGGIFFFKGGIDIDTIYKIKKNCDNFVILDEEMGTEKENYARIAKRRIWPNSEEYIDKYFVIGNYAYNASSNIFPRMKNSIKCTGWPRIDLWRKEHELLFAKQTELISKKYGKFILFVSDFGYNSKKFIDGTLNRIKNSKWKSLVNELSLEKERAKRTFREYNNFLKLLRECDKIKECPLIIIRPHPAEDIEAWFNFSKELTNIKVIYEGEITPWINASSGLLHRGCTSAIQAYIRGLPIGYYVTEKSAIVSGTPYSISQHLFTLDELLQFCIHSINISVKESDIKYSDEFTNMIHIEKDKFASELIIENLSKLKTNLEKKHKICLMDKLYNVFKLISSGLRTINDFIFKTEKNASTTTRSQKIPGGINKNEIEEFFHKVSSKEKFKVTKIFKDCFEIEL